ncbi:gluconate 5-dehydrogenase [Brachybacterium aquaticum]|uniref:Gluconate 5-dehydrogenase n=1 Tax=Brachybacterium aquaticum TaxID=1432564 RepID=A0A841AD02_9MICO|nr:gluconate 5-dehydrogenase [Brachybacterium aquaticum]
MSESSAVRDSRPGVGSSSLFSLTGRTAPVTGSTRGIGRALATGLVRAGARVIVHGRDPERAATAADEIAREAGAAETSGSADAGGPDTAGAGAAGSGSTLSVGVDVTDPAAVDAAIGEIEAEHGTPDILVNNAGIQRRAPIAEFRDEDWDALVATNLSAAFYCARRVAAGMTARGSGMIIQIGSFQSQLARPWIAAYSATKGGIVMLTKGLAADLAPHGIQVNALAPAASPPSSPGPSSRMRSSPPGWVGAPPPGAGARWRSWSARWSSSPRTRAPSSTARRCTSTGA